MDPISWIGGVVGRAGRAVASGVSDLVHTAVGGLISLLGSLFGNVSGAWDELTTAAAGLEHAAETFGRGCWRQFDVILHHWIPKYAFTAWWWVTHPEQLSDALFWHLVRWLERRAFTAARYLGGFAAALLIHNLRQVLALIEDVIAAVL
jgi:hypothetical protein